jgi:hypothetical protein
VKFTARRTTSALEPYVRYARRFGPDCVHETAEAMFAAQLRTVRHASRERLPLPTCLTWVTPAGREMIFAQRELALRAHRELLRSVEAEHAEALARLRLELNLIPGANGKRPVRSRRRSREETRLLVQRLLDEGYVLAHVAEMLDIGENTARRYAARRRPADPHGYAAISTPNGHAKVAMPLSVQQVPS